MTLAPMPALSDLIAAGESVTSLAEFEAFRDALIEVGARYERPVGDMAGNVTAISASGDPQFLIFELVTNSIDGILERQAAQLRLRGDDVPTDPRVLGQQLWTGDAADIADRIVLRMRDSGEPQRPTFTMRDVGGIGIAADQVRRTIMSLGQSPKNTKLYLAGAFGKGGGTLHRESRGCVLIGRPSPELMAETGCADEIWITCVWATHEAGGKVRRWVYAVTDPFDDDRPAVTGSVRRFPAAGIDFEPGVLVTHIAYNAPDIAKHSKAAMDSRSLWVMGNTRIYDPVLPWSYNDERPASEDRRRLMYGRARGFRDGRPQQMRESPLVAHVPVQDPETGDVYELALAAFLFDRDARRNATARDHVVCFVTNGQVQAHWDASETRRRTAEAQGSYTGLGRIAEQVLFLEVGCDGIPHVRRSEMVAPDRTHLTANSLARAVQTAAADWLVNQPTLLELERDMALNVSRGGAGVVISDKVLDEIGRKLGFTGVGAPTATPVTRPPDVLLPEPTQLVGPTTVTVVAGKTKQIGFTLNAEDDFFTRGGGTATLVVTDLDRPVRGTTGALSRGRFTSALVMDDSVDEAMYSAACVVEWLSATGSIKELRWDLKVRFVHDEPDVAPPPPKPGSRPLVIFQSEGGPESPGRLEDQLSGKDWAEMAPEQAAHAAKAGDNRVVAIVVNDTFKPWLRYVDELARHTTSDAVVTTRRNRYIVGAACAIGRLYGAAKVGDDLASVPVGLQEQVAALCAESVIASLPSADV